MNYEVVNNKDKSRMSRAHGKGSSTLFDTELAARKWMESTGLSSLEYSVLAAKED